MTIPPPEKDRFPYPEDTVVALADDAAAVADAVRKLEAIGIGGDGVDLLEGPEGAGRIDPDGQEHGTAGQRKRRIQDITGSDAANARQYAEHLRLGGRLLAVGVGDREQAQQAGGALREAGLTSVRYYSRHLVESL